jgi:hypothetical protein
VRRFIDFAASFSDNKSIVKVCVPIQSLLNGGKGNTQYADFVIPANTGANEPVLVTIFSMFSQLLFT